MGLVGHGEFPEPGEFAFTPEPRVMVPSAPSSTPRDVGRLFVDLNEPLRAVARRYLRDERRWHTLQPTALVNEAFLRLAGGGGRTRYANERAFLAAAAVAIRRVLVNHAKARAAMKRGGAAARVPLDEATPVAAGPSIDLVALDEALHELKKLDPRQCRVVELLFFGGLPIDRAAEVLDVSPSTVDADWAMARAFLRRRMGASPEARG